MMNAILGKYKDCLASPFLLVHGVGQDEHTWMPLFLLCYFHHKKDGNGTHSKHMAHMMDGVVIGCSLASNALMVYNPRNLSITSRIAIALIPIDFRDQCTPH
jgi:hypothetical protein